MRNADPIPFAVYLLLGANRHYISVGHIELSEFQTAVLHVKSHAVLQDTEAVERKEKTSAVVLYVAFFKRPHTAKETSVIFTVSAVFHILSR